MESDEFPEPSDASLQPVVVCCRDCSAEWQEFRATALSIYEPADSEGARFVTGAGRCVYCTGTPVAREWSDLDRKRRGIDGL